MGYFLIIFWSFLNVLNILNVLSMDKLPHRLLICIEILLVRDNAQMIKNRIKTKKKNVEKIVIKRQNPQCYCGLNASFKFLILNLLLFSV